MTYVFGVFLVAIITLAFIRISAALFRMSLDFERRRDRRIRNSRRYR